MNNIKQLKKNNIYQKMDKIKYTFYYNISFFI